MEAERDVHLASDLIDHLYAAAFGEAPWQVFMDRSRDLLPNGQTVLFHHDRQSCCGAFSLAGGIDPAAVEKYNRRYHAINPWMDHATRRPLGVVMQADEMLPRADLLRTDFYAEYLRPQDVVTGLGVTLSRDEDRNFFFSIVCADAPPERIAGAKWAMGRVMPHLMRAFGSFQALTEARPSAGTLRIDGRLRVLGADRLALELLAETEDLAVGPLGRLSCTDAEVLRIIRLMLAPDDEAGARPAIWHGHLRRRDGALPLRLCIYRPGPTAAAHVGAQDCFLRLECPLPCLRAGALRFGAIHRLSAVETLIVRRLAEGARLEQIAAERRTSPDTVRTQLKSIFRKSGCSSQGDILRHVAVLSTPS